MFDCDGVPQLLGVRYDVANQARPLPKVAPYRA
jgi:hypothetical protein